MDALYAAACFGMFAYGWIVGTILYYLFKPKDK